MDYQDAQDKHFAYIGIDHRRALGLEDAINVYLPYLP